MERFSLITVLKYLGGILLAQAAAVVMAIAAFEARLLEHWGVFAVFALLIGIFAALWFAAIANGTRHHAVARVKDDFAREREKIRVQSEKDKSKLIAQTHRETLKTIRRMQAGASFKVGLGFAALLGLGGIMLLSQFVTVGLLTLSTAGGALLGYVVRARQDQLERKRARGERMFHRSEGSGTIQRQALPLTLDGLVEKHRSPLED
ncbi:MAG: hypothetical protein ACREXY_13750 [Gammaproteobacteria bacterium]